MKKLLILTILLMSTKCFSQTIKTVQTVTTDATISATADVVLVTSGTDIDLTLPTGSAGRTISIINHSTDDVSFNLAIRRANGFTFQLMTSSPNEFDSTVSTNSITIIYDGSEWRLLNY